MLQDLLGGLGQTLRAVIDGDLVAHAHEEAEQRPGALAGEIDVIGRVNGVLPLVELAVREGEHNGPAECGGPFRFGRVHVIEVKGTAARDYRPPRMTRNVGGTQMSREWVVSTLNRDGQTHLEGVDAVGEGPDQVGRSVIQVDERGGTVSVWEHVGDDGRLDTSGGPDRVYSLADVRDVQRAGR